MPRVFKSIGSLLGLKRPDGGGASLRPRLPEGRRIYAIGDIHGRLDLFEQMVAQIEADDTDRGDADTLVILLGDLVDRGADSAGVIAAARAWQKTRPVRMLMGNHEEMFLRSLNEEAAMRQFLRVGGRETVLSFGLTREEYRTLSHDHVITRMRELVPADVVAWLQSAEDIIAEGDYVFAHAGIDPAAAIDAQSPSNLRWIREPFLSHGEKMAVCVVHGHTIRDEVEIRRVSGWPNRIGIDTGAFRTGRLTALGLQGSERWVMEASQD